MVEPSNTNNLEESKAPIKPPNRLYGPVDMSLEPSEEIRVQPQDEEVKVAIAEDTGASEQLADLIAQLGKKCDALNILKKYKALLINGLEKNRFKSASKMVLQALEKDEQYETADKLEDILPLFEPHTFWDNQPVPWVAEGIRLKPEAYDKPIEVKTVDQVSAEPYPLPDGYVWDNLDLEDDAVLQEMYDLLVQNYVEDEDAMFRFDYSKDFIRWALLVPGQKPEWLVCVRAAEGRKLFACIAGIPVTMTLNGHRTQLAEINFLCIHKRIRTQRLAPLMIKEITRRVNRCDIWQAVYTAAVTIPTPITGCTYWLRGLNPKKLLDIEFSEKPSNIPISAYIRSHQLPAEPSIPEMRPMVETDVPEVARLLNEYLSGIKMHMNFTEEEVAHFFIPRPGVVHAYVVGEQGSLTDFFSFYCLHSSILKHPDYETLYVGYCYYNVSTTNRLKEGMGDLLIKAKELGFDVFNALDCMENKSFFAAHKFMEGDGELHYYLYNWRISDVVPEDIGYVLC